MVPIAWRYKIYTIIIFIYFLSWKNENYFDLVKYSKDLTWRKKSCGKKTFLNKFKIKKIKSTFWNTRIEYFI